MFGFLLAFLTAFFESLKDVFSKRGLKRKINEYYITWALSFFALPFLLPFLFFIKIPALGIHFWPALFIGGSLNIIAWIIYMKAIKYSDLSLTVPLVTFTPLFLLITSPLMIKELPSTLGIFGVLLIVIGSYLLHFKERFKGFTAPFKALLKEKGPKLMLLVAFIWSITANIDKIGLKNSSPLFWAIAINIFIAFAMSVLVLFRLRKEDNKAEINLKLLMPVGLFYALTSIFQMSAINLILVAYVIAIKRTSIILSVLFGHFIFKEKHLKERLIGVIVMILGVFFITLS